MQENKITILSTRPIDTPLIQQAAQRGIIVETIKFIRTEPIISDSIKNKINELSNQSLTIVFTSMNAVETVGDYLNNQPAHWKIFCMGTTTNKLVAEIFGASSIAGIANNATALADKIIATNTIDKVIFFCGDQRRDELPQQLSTHHISNEKINKEYSGILFFSPSAVDSFFSANQANTKTILFAIGNTTANTIQQYSTNKIIISDEPGKENLLEKVMNYRFDDLVI
ncbi:MAG: uroporphyrinogen-III synthase [Sphingobacteriales bacterium]|nr:uroporphyrinogen-III synthase [Sphingobacteriales bacterium]